MDAEKAEDENGEDKVVVKSQEVYIYATDSSIKVIDASDAD